MKKFDKWGFFLFMASKVKKILNSRASDSQLLFEVLIIISQYIDEDMKILHEREVFSTLHGLQ